MPVSNPRGALQLDEQTPELACDGWVNGSPPEFGDADTRYLVVDLWGQWCSEVPKSIPQLIQLHEEFRPRGVAFVSLTTEKREVVEQFVKTHLVPWSSGYQASLEMINAIGAYNFTMGMSGYEVKPILYLVDSQGRVVWTDNHQRMDHRDEDKTALIAALRKELQSRLDDSES